MILPDESECAPPVPPVPPLHKSNAWSLVLPLRFSTSNKEEFTRNPSSGCQRARRTGRFCEFSLFKDVVSLKRLWN